MNYNLKILVYEILLSDYKINTKNRVHYYRCFDIASFNKKLLGTDFRCCNKNQVLN